MEHARPTTPVCAAQPRTGCCRTVRAQRALRVDTVQTAHSRVRPAFTVSAIRSTGPAHVLAVDTGGLCATRFAQGDRTHRVAATAPATKRLGCAPAVRMYFKDITQEIHALSAMRRICLHHAASPAPGSTGWCAMDEERASTAFAVIANHSRMKLSSFFFAADCHASLSTQLVSTHQVAHLGTSAQRAPICALRQHCQQHHQQIKAS